ncbi:hypothetical protein [Nodularia sphaerocarpa]|uniref:hypothetical protein n=1 Tax=Nodularia sphaerocarpa TaxID=137816 RepID=UPI001EFA7B40|nr:hypothetical protein [Nodularia sphaerocarpa]MDB9373765.1 hypothetical protein [Nodularia sphaerocarpa CS-585]MDB9377552.1 hypothetical protein [Nodularia sphaerocarpa CS-585A2]ULP72927.1 hypothetical protein BDGGKGIB_02579 [Nodularia sphaerocarpa UHCC 0038]
MNKITTNPDLANVDYTDLLTKILQALKNEQIFEIRNQNKWLLIDINKIASQIAALQVDSPLGNAKSVKTATLNFTSGSQEKFPEQIREITACIQNSLTKISQNTDSPDRFALIKQLITDLQKFRVKSDKFDLTYNFPKSENLQKQRLTLKKDDSKQRQLLKAHKLKISVDKPRDFPAQLLEGINNYIDTQFGDASSTDREDIEYILENLKENSNSDIYKLENLVNQQTLGKLKKLAKIRYLEFLSENVSHEIGKIYLVDLIRRLKLLDDFINDSSKADGEYLVNYLGIAVNYQNIFSRSEAFDMLPIIPVIAGYLGETENEHGEKVEFVFGIKLKFDGKVQAYGGRTVFDYNLNLLNPDSKEHKQEIADESRKFTFANKVLKIALLYYFVFASRENPSDENYNPHNELNYNPREKFEKDVLPILQGSDDEAKKNLFKRFLKGFETFKVQQKINTLKKVLENLIKCKTPFPSREYPLHISVKYSILENDIDTINDRDTLFKSGLEKNPKDCLKYINLGEATTQTNSLVSLQAKMTISEIHFLETDDRETFQMEYDIDKIDKTINVLPVVFLPAKNEKCRNFYNTHFPQRNLLIFPYQSEIEKLDSHQEFIYKITYSLLAYICVYVLLEKQSKLFLPILRIHLKKKTDNAPLEKFIVSLTGVLSHLFNEKSRSNSQGIDISDFSSKGKFKIPNTLSSLYSVLPKKFTLQNPDKFEFKGLDKLAIIVVSSRVSDSKWGTETKKSNLMGEIIDFQIQPQTVTLRLLKTFSENYDDHQDMFEYPSVVVENVNKLYQKGYRHFIYIAKVPYSSTLHITQTEDDGLYFMSKNVITALRTQRDDIKIYPMFFEKYYAVKVGDNLATSLYIQDTIELTELAEDSNKQSVIFFNLFNGIAVAKDNNYNGVMSYATLLNIYKGILDDEDIRRGLISNQSQLKNEILQCLTLFHFSRYEKSGKVELKLDPYQNLIGDESIGELALFKHSRGTAEFNSLAFLTYIRDILQTPKQSS